VKYMQQSDVPDYLKHVEVLTFLYPLVSLSGHRKEEQLE
jgi:hypothetical protein